MVFISNISLNHSNYTHQFNSTVTSYIWILSIVANRNFPSWNFPVSRIADICNICKGAFIASHRPERWTENVLIIFVLFEVLWLWTIKSPHQRGISCDTEEGSFSSFWFLGRHVRLCAQLSQHFWLVIWTRNNNGYFKVAVFWQLSFNFRFDLQKKIICQKCYCIFVNIYIYLTAWFLI